MAHTGLRFVFVLMLALATSLLTKGCLNSHTNGLYSFCGLNCYVQDMGVSSFGVELSEMETSESEFWRHMESRGMSTSDIERTMSDEFYQGDYQYILLRVDGSVDRVRENQNETTLSAGWGIARKSLPVEAALSDDAYAYVYSNEHYRVMTHVFSPHGGNATSELLSPEKCVAVIKVLPRGRVDVIALLLDTGLLQDGEEESGGH